MGKFKFFRRLPKSKDLLTYSAVVISVCALFTTVYQTYILEQQKHASVWPRLSLYHGWNVADSTGLYRLQLRNTGIGPAIIRQVRITYKDKGVKDLAELSSLTAEGRVGGNGLSYEDYSDIIPDMVVPQQTQQELLSLTEKEQVEAFVNELRYIRVAVVYESLYGRQWEVTYPGVTHREVD